MDDRLYPCQLYLTIRLVYCLHLTIDSSPYSILMSNDTVTSKIEIKFIDQGLIVGS